MSKIMNVKLVALITMLFVLLFVVFLSMNTMHIRGLIGSAFFALFFLSITLHSDTEDTIIRKINESQIGSK